MTALDTSAKGDPRDAQIRDLEARLRESDETVQKLRAKLPTDFEAIAKEVRKRFLKFIVERVNPGFQDRHRGDLSSWTPELWQESGQLGLVGFNAVKEIGGEGRDAAAWNIVCEEVGKIIEDPGFMVITLINKNWANLIASEGRQDLMDRYAKPIITGDAPLAWAIWEPAEMSYMKSVAKKVEGGWLINAHKPIVTGGMYARVYGVIVREESSNDQVCFLVETEDPGVERVPLPTVGAHHCGFASVTLRDTVVPDDRMLLPTDAIGGVSRLFNHGVLNTAAVHLGWMQRMLGLCIDALRSKVRAGVAVLDLPHVQSELGRLHIGIEQCRSVFIRVIESYRRGDADPLAEPLTVVFKHSVAERTMDTAKTIMTLMGAAGYMDEGPWGRYLTHTHCLLHAAGAQDLGPQILGGRLLMELEMRRLRKVGL